MIACVREHAFSMVTTVMGYCISKVQNDSIDVLHLLLIKHLCKSEVQIVMFYQCLIESLISFVREFDLNSCNCLKIYSVAFRVHCEVSLITTLYGPCY